MNYVYTLLSAILSLILLLHSAMFEPFDVDIVHLFASAEVYGEDWNHADCIMKRFVSLF